MGGRSFIITSGAFRGTLLYLFHYSTSNIMFWGPKWTCTTIKPSGHPLICVTLSFASVWHRWEDVPRVHLHLYHYDTENMIYQEKTCTCTTLTKRRLCYESTLSLVPLWHRGDDVMSAILHMYPYDTEDMMLWVQTYTCTPRIQRYT